MLRDAIYVQLLRQFQRSGQKIPEILYDVDDMLWSCIGASAERAGLPLECCAATYSVTDNPLLAKAEQERLIECFHDVKTFQNMQFYQGVADILRPRELGAEVKLKTNSFSEEIAQAKETQLLTAVPGLRAQDIEHNIISWDNRHKKPMSETTTILADDSPYNVQASPALINFMPATLAWTHDACALKLVRGRLVIRTNNLVEMNLEIYKLTGVLMGLQNPRTCE